MGYPNLTYKATVELDDDAVISCGDDECGWTGLMHQGVSIKTATLTPGDPSPACRCPICGSLSYPD